jgi:predicted transcriptional regulator
METIDLRSLDALKKECLEDLYTKMGSMRAVSEATGLSVSGIYRHVKHIIRERKHKKQNEAMQKISQGMSALRISKSTGVGRETVRRLSKTPDVKQAATPATNKAFTATPAIDAVVNLSYRMEKFKIRKWIVDTADTMLSDISAITFPGTEWTMERDLFLKCGEKVKNITALEKDPVIYEFSRHNIPPVNGKVKFLCKADSELFSSIALQPYNLLWLDYMGPFMHNKLESFREAIKNGYVADRAIVCLTFLNGRDKSMTEIYKGHADNDIRVGNGKYNNARLKVIPEMYADAALPYGFATSVISAYLYKERQGGVPKSPMLFLSLVMEKSATAREAFLKEKGLNNIMLEILKILPAPVNQIYSLDTNKKNIRNAIRDLLKGKMITFGMDGSSRDVIYRLTQKGNNLLNTIGGSK